MTTTNTTTAPFSYDAANLEEQVAYGRGVHVRFNVHGYWSDVVNVRVQRQHDWRASFEEREEVAEWTADVSHSSGGRDPKQIASEIEAERNFGAAVLAACDLAEALLARRDELEAAYQARRAADDAAAAAARAEREAKIAADPAIGDEAAGAYVDALIANTRVPNTATRRQLTARTRGDDERNREVIIAKRDWDGRVRLSRRDSPISRKAAIALVATLAWGGLVADEPLPN